MDSVKKPSVAKVMDHIVNEERSCAAHDAAASIVRLVRNVPVDTAIEALANLFVMAAADARYAQAVLATINRISIHSH